MKAKSTHTLKMDPYRAGIALAEAVQDVSPEVLFLFSTIHYGASPELTEAIYDVLGPDLVLIGTTGDGFYENRKIADIGASALALNSEGCVRWSLTYQTNVAAYAHVATRSCLERHYDHGASAPDLFFLVSDFRADASEVLRALQQTTDVPVVGGYAGDDTAKMHSCYTYANREVLQDAVVVLGMAGNFDYDIKLAHDLKPVGNPGILTEACKKRVRRINGLPAMEFLEKELGKPVEVVDQGIVCFDVLDKVDRDTKCLRSIVPDYEARDGSVKLFGAVEAGREIQVCLANAADLVREVQRVGKSLKKLPFEPAAGIIVSCSGRKHLLGNHIEHEVQQVLEGTHPDFPLAGFPSFGELAPIRRATGYSPLLFHNMTYILLLMGASAS